MKTILRIETASMPDNNAAMGRLTPVALALLLLAGCNSDPAPDPEQSVVEASASNAGRAVPVAPAAPRNTATPAPPAARSADPVLAVEAEGLRLFDPATGSARPIAFGRPEEQVLATLEKMRGPAGKGVNQDCGAGPVQYANWPDGLSLVFQNGDFAGWSLDGRGKGAVTTASGIGPGSTRRALEDAYSIEVRQSTLGTEFGAGDLYGLLDGPGREARVTNMWAGISCNAR